MGWPFFFVIFVTFIQQWTIIQWQIGEYKGNKINQVDSLFQGNDNKIQDLNDRIRIGDYRVVYRILDENKIVIIFAAQHRKDIYR